MKRKNSKSTEKNVSKADKVADSVAAPVAGGQGLVYTPREDKYLDPDEALLVANKMLDRIDIPSEEDLEIENLTQISQENSDQNYLV